MFLIFLSSYAYLHDKFYYVCQASFCIVSRLQRHLVSTLLFVLFLFSVLVYDQHKQSDYVTLFQVRLVDIGGIVDHHCFRFLS
jgi:hypothetical protein